MKQATFFLCIFFCLVSLQAESIVFNETFHSFMESQDPLDLNPPDRETTLRRELLKQARWTFSAMIYGFKVHYRPSDKTRQVAEIFELEPYREIPWGDPSLKIAQSWIKEKQLYCRITYTLSKAQQSWYRKWQSPAFPLVESRGSASFLGGFPLALQESIRNSLKQGIKAHLSPSLRNKPRDIHALILLEKTPRYSIKAGEYHSRTKFRILVRKVNPYRY